jgi:predicted transcriptional regulator
MNTKQNHQDFLKHLRERNGHTPQSLAELSRVHVSMIYKADKQLSNVKIETIRKIYHSLCKNEDEWATLFLLWAHAADNGQTPLYRMNEAMKALREEYGESISPWISKITHIVAGIEVADLPLLEWGIKEYASNPHARDIVRSWKSTKEDMTRQ